MSNTKLRAKAYKTNDVIISFNVSSACNPSNLNTWEVSRYRYIHTTKSVQQFNSFEVLFQNHAYVCENVFFNKDYYY